MDMNVKYGYLLEEKNTSGQNRIEKDRNNETGRKTGTWLTIYC